MAGIWLQKTLKNVENREKRSKIVQLLFLIINISYCKFRVYKKRRHQSENPRAGSSILSLGTLIKKGRVIFDPAFFKISLLF
ncbi:MAG: hypothetical protein BBJ57_13350 [Desulfobacterales bacterium PC51MH44]|nr:MAG: hypothetical protein BBJ57_13350 [Desulfobacterales bacterium PC51MH44]